MSRLTFLAWRGIPRRPSDRGCARASGRGYDHRGCGRREHVNAAR